VAVYLDEDRVGSDPAEICYPHLLLCMGVTLLMADGSLMGAHVCDNLIEPALLAELQNAVNNSHLGMVKLYCAGNYKVHTVQFGCMTVQQKAAALGFHGDAYLFNTGTIRPKDGTFVAVRSNGPAHNCGVYYKRDEKVKGLYDRSNIAHNPMITKVGRRGPTQENSVVGGLTGPIHKLHKAGHFMQMKHYTIP
jgi:hypothetical protein